MAENPWVGDWTVPRRNCARCGAHTLVNKMGDEWCSMIGCDWFIHVGPAVDEPRIEVDHIDGLDVTITVEPAAETGGSAVQ